MSLKNFKIERTPIPMPGDNEPINVRGLGLEDFGLLISNHLVEITDAAERYAAMKQDIYTTANLQGFILVLVRDFPKLLSEVISIAADEPDAKDVQLPFGPQVSAITEIARLTLVDAGGLGNLLAILGSALKGAGGDSLEGSLKHLLSQSFIGGLGKKLPSSSPKASTKPGSGRPRKSGTKPK